MSERAGGPRSHTLRFSLWLSWMEIRRSAFGLTAPDSRDFRELILFMALLSLFVSLMLSVQAGLLDRLADSFLGKVDEAGFPLVATAGLNTLQKVDRTVLNAFEPTQDAEAPTTAFPNAPPALTVPRDLRTLRLAAHPFRVLYGSEGVFGFQPAPDADDAWKARLGGRQMPFDGWAVLTETDPLWAWGMARSHSQSDETRTPFPNAPPIMLNLAAFGHLDYAAYRAALLKNLPEPLVDATAPRLTVDAATGAARAADLRTLDVIWLWEGIRPGVREAIPFRAHWVDRFPAMDMMSCLVPADVVAVLERSATWPGFTVFPEHGVGEGRRVRVLQIFPASSATGPLEATVAMLSACLSPLGEPSRGGLPQWRFERPQPLAVVDACLTAANLPPVAHANGGVVSTASGPVRAIRLETVISSSYRTEPAGYLEIRCDEIGMARQGLVGGCTERDIGLGRIDFLSGFDGATIYTEQRDRLRQTRDALLGLRRGHNQVFWIAPTYERAMDRFHFIEGVLSAARVPVIVVGGAFAVFLLLFFLGVLVSHRRRTYALMLAQGLDAASVRFIVAVQVAIATLVAIPLGILGAVLVRKGLSWSGANDVVQRLARETLGTDGVEIMPAPDPVMLGWAAALLLGLSMLLLLARLAAMPLRSRTEPTDLMR